MVEGSQRRILRIWLFSSQPNPQKTRVEHYDVHWKSFSWISQLPIFCSCGLVGDGTVDGKDNKEEKTREVADSRMYPINWKFSLTRMWNAVVVVVNIFPFTCLTKLSTCNLVVDRSVDGKGKNEGKTRSSLTLGCITSVVTLVQLGC